MDKEKEKKFNKGKSSNIEQKLARERTELSYDRTGLSILRTNLAFQSSRMSVEQTHLSYLRTIVSLIGSSATIYKALPALGVSGVFSTILACFLMLSAIYFIIKDRKIYPKLSAEIEEMERQRDEIISNSRADLPHV
ncbi:MAG: hypothetical protein K6B28_10065 [Lachnospiraceae bacterium]|nr:hypothetical protein [Lachnospiraceae bacterium]